MIDELKWKREDVAALKEDVRSWQQTVDSNKVDIPKLERETLECERDIAVAKLKIIELEKEIAEWHPKPERTVTQ